MKRLLLICLLTGFTTLSQAAKSTTAPDFSLPGGKGKVNLANYRGRVVYLDFWATWCKPCRKSFPWMQQMYQKYRRRGFRVIAVNLDKDPGEVKRFLAENKIDFVIAYDPKGKVAEKYDLKAMPSSFLIDKKGRIQARHIGFRESTKAERENEIQSLLLK